MCINKEGLYGQDIIGEGLYRKDIIRSSMYLIEYSFSGIMLNIT